MEDVAPQRERIGLYENRRDESAEEEDVAFAIENEFDDPACEQAEYPQRVHALSGKTGGELEVVEVQECNNSLEEPSEAPHEVEARRLHEPIMRGELALEDNRPHHEWSREEPRHEAVHPNPKRRAWYLSEPISVKPWQSTPHLRSGFSLV